MKQTLAMSLVLCVVTPSTAFAYLDGGTISMALQLIAGGIGIGFLFIRRWVDAVKNFFSSKKSDAGNKDNQHRLD